MYQEVTNILKENNSLESLEDSQGSNYNEQGGDDFEPEKVNPMINNNLRQS